MSFTAEAYLNTDGTHWYRYKDGTTGLINPGGGKAPLLLGVAQKDYDGYQTQITSTNKMSVRRSYDNNMPSTFAASAASGDPGRQCASIWSWSDTSQVAAVASGSLNATLTSFFNSIPAGHKMWCVFWHEVDLHYTNYATYKSAYATIRTQLEASNADTSLVKVGGLLTSSGFRAGHGNDYFDTNHMFVGVDSYEFWRPQGSPNDPKTGSLSQHRTTSYLWGDGISGGVNDTANRIGAEIICGEYGQHYFPPSDPNYATGRRDLRMQQAVDYMDSNESVNGQPVTALTWFHSSAGGSGPWWMNCVENWTTPDDQSTPDPNTVAKWESLIQAHAVYSGS